LSGSLSPLTNALESPKRTSRSKFVRNVAANLARLLIGAVISLLLPVYLTRHLPVEIYGAWVLILQLSAYVSFLDMGIQTAVSKHVAEYDAKGDYETAGRFASAGLIIMFAASVLGVILTTFLSWRVPHFFQNMPASLYSDVRVSVMLIGFSLSFSLACSVFAGIFLGLQSYQIPVAISILNRVLFALATALAVHFQSRLALVGAAVAFVNVFTAILQIVSWRALAKVVPVNLRQVTIKLLKKMLQYCMVLAIWSAAMLFISGLDLTLVGHYDYSQTAYFSIAIAPTALVVVLLSAILGPFMPAASALSTTRTPDQMGEVLCRTTRYSAIVLYLTGLPLILGGFYILKAWVGPEYATNTTVYLRILVLANMLRNFGLPYATMVVATDKQLPATAAPITEAIVNVTSSIWLARHIGAAGVALGTLLGALFSIGIHFFVSMRYTRGSLSISRLQLFTQGLLRPSVIALPTIFALPLWWFQKAPVISLKAWTLWACFTLLLTWFAALSRSDRATLFRVA